MLGLIRRVRWELSRMCLLAAAFIDTRIIHAAFMQVTQERVDAEVLKLREELVAKAAAERAEAKKKEDETDEHLRFLNDTCVTLMAGMRPIDKDADGTLIFKMIETQVYH